MFVLGSAREGLRLTRQSSTRFPVPVEPLRMTRPEGLWVRERLFQRRSLWVCHDGLMSYGLLVEMLPFQGFLTPVSTRGPGS